MGRKFRFFESGSAAAQAIAESDWFEIFRTGVWHDERYDLNDLQQMVDNFRAGDPAIPLIIGHNSWWGSEEKPALGWVMDLKIEGASLLAKARNVQPELVEAVNRELYPKRSVEIWFDYKGRGMALGAIAFLGGSNPEVGGMADFTFEARGEKVLRRHRAAEEKRCFVALQVEEPPAAINNGGHFTRGGEFEMTEAELRRLLEEATRTGAEQAVAQMGKTLEDANRTIAQLQANLTEQRIGRHVEGCQAFAQGLLDEKRITPAVLNAGLVCFLASLDAEQTADFGGGKQETQLDAAKRLFGALPKTHAGLVGTKETGAVTHGHSGIAGTVAGDPGTEAVNSQVAALAQKYGMDAKLLQKHVKGQVSTLTMLQSAAQLPNVEDAEEQD